MAVIHFFKKKNICVIYFCCYLNIKFLFYIIEYFISVDFINCYFPFYYSRELDIRESENIQSAQYGLSLLDEKQSLQGKCEELEILYENTKLELDITQEVNKFKYQH